jgi:hypothetical protein
MITNLGNCKACVLEEQLREHVRKQVYGEVGRLGNTRYFTADVETDLDADNSRRYGSIKNYWTVRIGKLKRCLEKESVRSQMDKEGIAYVERMIELLEGIRDAGGSIGRNDINW